MTSNPDDAPTPPEQFLYLTTTGHLSGSPRTIEIWFVEHGGLFYIFAGNHEETTWVKNLVKNPDVTVRVGTKDDGASPVSARARVVRDAEVIARIKPLMDAKYKWSGGLPVEIAPVAPAGRGA